MGRIHDLGGGWTRTDEGVWSALYAKTVKMTVTKLTYGPDEGKWAWEVAAGRSERDYGTSASRKGAMAMAEAQAPWHAVLASEKRSNYGQD